MASLLKEPLTQEAMDGAMKDIDVGLALLFDQAKVPTDIQAMIVSLGYSDAGVFAAIGGGPRRTSVRFSRPTWASTLRRAPSTGP